MSIKHSITRHAFLYILIYPVVFIVSSYLTSSADANFILAGVLIAMLSYGSIVSIALGIVLYPLRYLVLVGLKKKMVIEMTIVGVLAVVFNNQLSNPIVLGPFLAWIIACLILLIVGRRN